MRRDAISVGTSECLAAVGLLVIVGMSLYLKTVPVDENNTMVPFADAHLRATHLAGDDPLLNTMLNGMVLVAGGYGLLSLYRGLGHLRDGLWRQPNPRGGEQQEQVVLMQPQPGVSS